MPNWNELYKEITNYPSALDAIRKKYLKKLYNYRRRNIIAYYSGFLNRPNEATAIHDSDKELFMSAIHGLDRSKGLDLILHTQGGNVAATESIVDYLLKMFNNDIIVFVPQIAMSAGTLVALASKEIVMGSQSNLGPIDPQFNGIPAKLIIQEFREAKNDLEENKNIEYWKIRLQQFPPTFLKICENAIKWSEQLARDWLKVNMFSTDKNADEKIESILKYLSEPDETYSHGRHIHKEKAMELGLKIMSLEKDQKLQDLLLTVHHAYMHTFQNSNAIKVVENHKGNATIIQKGRTK